MIDHLYDIYRFSGPRLRRAIVTASRLCRFATFLPRRFRVGGYTMVLDPTDAAYFRCRRYRGDYEAAAVAVTLDSLRNNQNSIFVDVGASYGFYTLAAAELAVRKGGVKRIYAIEPDPRPVQALRRAIDLNGFADVAEIHQFAVGDFTGKTHLLKNRKASTGNRAFASPGNQEDYSGIENVDAISLNSFLLERYGSGDRFVIKIDVEGAEVRVLRGAMRALSEAAGYTVVIEYHPAGIRECGFTPEEFINAVEMLEPDVVFRVPKVTPALDLRTLITDIELEVGTNSPEGRILYVARGMHA